MTGLLLAPGLQMARRAMAWQRRAAHLAGDRVRAREPHQGWVVRHPWCPLGTEPAVPAWASGNPRLS